MHLPDLDVTSVKLHPHAWIGRFASKDLDVSGCDWVERVYDRGKMVTAADKVLEEDTRNHMVQGIIQLHYLCMWTFEKSLTVIITSLENDVFNQRHAGANAVHHSPTKLF